MPPESRQRLLTAVRHPNCDLAEVALLCDAEADPDLDVDAQLLRIDALADGLRARGFRAGDPRRDAEALAGWLAEDSGFQGDVETYNDPRNALLHHVLDRRRGLPITLSILYTAVGRRLDVPIYGIGLPGHFVAGIGGDADRVVLDPFHGGRLLTDTDLDELVRTSTAGQAHYHRAMLGPASASSIVRRLLNNLTRDFLAANRVTDALWTVELKELLPGASPEDLRVRGELLLRRGQYRAAATALEGYLERQEDSPDYEKIRRLAVSARAKLN